MANGDEGNVHGRYGSPGGQMVLAGVGLAVGVLVTFLTASIYLGGTFERVNTISVREDALQKRMDLIDQSGALRQVEINTARLGQLESSGSPQLATIRESLSNQQLRVQHIESLVGGLPDVDAAIRREVATMQAQIMQLRQQLAAINADLRPREFWENLSGRTSTLDAEMHDVMQTRDQGVVQWGLVVQRVAALESRATAMEEQAARLRDRVVQHENADLSDLRDRAGVNARKGIRDAP